MPQIDGNLGSSCVLEWLPFLQKVATTSSRRYVELVYPDGWVTEVVWAPLDRYSFLKTACFYLRWLWHSDDLRHPNHPQWRMMCAVYAGRRTPRRHPHPAWDSDPGLNSLCLSQNPLMLPCKFSELFSLVCVWGCVCIEVSEKYDAGGGEGMICARGSFVNQLLRSP